MQEAASLLGLGLMSRHAEGFYSLPVYLTDIKKLIEDKWCP